MRSIRIPSQVAAAMATHSANEAPDEACGLLAGLSGEVRFFYPLTNVDASPHRYTVDPAGHVRALLHAERAGWELIGVFHSHPAGRAVPSQRDVTHAFERDWLYAIEGRDGLRAWRLAGSVPREVIVEVT